MKNFFPSCDETASLVSVVQDVINAAKNFKDWTFLFLSLPRQKVPASMAAYTCQAGKGVLVGGSFVNLLISSECDYFVGTLGSNWNRLINELRSTNGRLYAGYLALNNAEF